MSERVLILGGTREAATLAEKLIREGNYVITSLAGRTKEPAPVAGEIRSGGFGGIEPMAQWISTHAITKVIDATHPFATTISANAREACRIAGVELVVKKRGPWSKHSGDNWIEVKTLQDAAATIPPRSRVLLALGSQHLSEFAQRHDVHFVIRMVDKPDTPLHFKNHDLLLAKPSPEWQAEAALLQRYGVTHIVCRNSGGEGAYAKIVAARHLAIPVIIVSMPQ